MGIDTMTPGNWPTDQQSIDELFKLACQRLGRDFQHLAPEVVGRVAEEWRRPPKKPTDQMQIRTLIRSRADDAKKSEQKRWDRERKASLTSPTDAHEQRAQVFEAVDAIDRAGLGDVHKSVLRMICQGSPRIEIAEALDISPYYVERYLADIGRVLWPDR